MIKLLVVACAVSIGAGMACADPSRETVSVKFHYDRSSSAVQNYAAFLGQARRACGTPGLKPLAQALQEKTCAADLMDKLVIAMGRSDLASVHAARTGRGMDASRTLAAR